MTTKTDAETERDRIENAYSYVRLSSKKQLGDDRSGLDRQMARPKEICDAHGWNLQGQTFADLNVSSFHGRNRLQGNLGRFIALVKDGKLAPNPVLILESWDRYSRDTLDEAFESVRDLLKAGVAFHIAYGDRTFTKAALQSAESRGEIERALEAARNYSQHLSDRVSAAKQRKLARLANGDIGNLDDMAPSWVTFDKTTHTFKPNERAKAVAEIFNQYQRGQSIVGIARNLKTESVKPFYGKKWYGSSIRHILGSKTVTGEFKGKAVYPRIVQPDDFDDVQAMLERNKGNRGHRADLVNIFKGLVCCAECGETVCMTKNKGRNYAYYRCTGKAYGNCKQRKMFPAHLLEEDFFALILRQTPTETIGNADTNHKERLAALLTRQDTLNRKKKTLLALEDDSDSDIKARFVAIKGELEQVEKDIASIRNTISLIGNAPQALGEIEKALQAGDDVTELDAVLGRLQDTLKNKDIRQRLQVLMPSIIKQVQLDFAGFNFTVTFTSGKTVTHSIAT